MTWLLIAIFAPLLAATTDYIDKYIIEKYLKTDGVSPLIIVSAFVGFLVMPIVFFIEPSVLDTRLRDALFMMLSGGIYILAFYPYFKAMQEQEASRLIPLFQTVPIFSFLFGFLFLNESLNTLQIIGSSIILLGATTISFQLNNAGKISHFLYRPAVLIIMSSFMFSLNFFLFKFLSLESRYIEVVFWESLGFSIIGVLFLFRKENRSELHSFIKDNYRTIVSLNVFSEIVNIVAKFLIGFATILAPLAIISVIENGFEMVFVFIIGTMASLFFPNIIMEDIGKHNLIQKLFSILIILLGTILLSIV